MSLTDIAHVPSKCIGNSLVRESECVEGRDDLSPRLCNRCVLVSHDFLMASEHLSYLLKTQTW